MGRFSYEEWKNKVISNTDNESNDILSNWADYIVHENKKGKIPLIIVGAGISSCDVKIQINNGDEKKLNFEWSQKGLPCLQQMMQKLKELVDEERVDLNNEEITELKKQFEVMTDDMQNINREWLGRIFTLFEKSTDTTVKKIWKNFCRWFFFSCIEYEDKDGKKQYFGALNTKTSKVADEIVKLYDSVDAICLSANFDNHINYALTGTEGVK